MSTFDVTGEVQSKSYADEQARHYSIVESFIFTLRFCYLDTARDIQNSPRHFFLRVVDDFIQSIVAIKLLAEQGIINQCRRECRYLLETAVKACYVTQKNSNASYEDQITIYSQYLKDTNINQIDQVDLYLINELESNFISDLKRSYGELCNYVHCTPSQLREKLALANQGRYIGYSEVHELATLNSELEQVLSLIIVLLLHGVPMYAAGDLLVEQDGASSSFHYIQSKYIAKIDSRFDYKHERQNNLENIKLLRANRIRF